MNRNEKEASNAAKAAERGVPLSGDGKRGTRQRNRRQPGQGAGKGRGAQERLGGADRHRERGEKRRYYAVFRHRSVHRQPKKRVVSVDNQRVPGDSAQPVPNLDEKADQGHPGGRHSGRCQS